MDIFKKLPLSNKQKTFLKTVSIVSIFGFILVLFLNPFVYLNELFLALPYHGVQTSVTAAIWWLPFSCITIAIGILFKKGALTQGDMRSLMWIYPFLFLSMVITHLVTWWIVEPEMCGNCDGEMAVGFGTLFFVPIVALIVCAPLLALRKKTSAALQSLLFQLIALALPFLQTTILFLILTLIVFGLALPNALMEGKAALFL